MKKVFIYDKGHRNFNPDKYTHLRAYHGTRCLDEKSFKTYGIRTFSNEERKAQVLKMCDILELGTIQRKYVMDAFEKVTDTYSEAGSLSRVWLSCTKEQLLERAGHYLIYGSEFIIAVFSNGLHHFDDLASIGVPTIIACDVPIDSIDTEVWLPSMCDGMKRGDMDVCFPVGSIKPEDIVGFEYPTDIVDPYTQRKYHFVKK